jgi:RNA polymerase sigma-70 factor, ECF subfamily
MSVLSRTSAAAAFVHGDVHAEYAEPEEFIPLEAVKPVFEDGDDSRHFTAEASSGPAGPLVGRRGEKPSRPHSPPQRRVEGAVGGLAGSAVGATSLSEMNDHELLEGIRAESELHFAELYSRYFQRIYNFVYARMRNHAETEEVVQETFLAVFRSFGNYRGQSSLLSWIYGIAKNTTNNSLRRAKSQHDRIEMADDEDLIPRSSVALAMPDEQLDLHRFREQLSERLDTLATWQAEIFEMRHFENLSIPEISERTSRSSDAVRSSLYRVKRLFFDAALASGSSTMAAIGGNES